MGKRVYDSPLNSGSAGWRCCLRYELPNAGMRVVRPRPIVAERRRKNTDSVTASPTLCAFSQLLGVTDTYSCIRLAFIGSAPSSSTRRLVGLCYSSYRTVRRMATCAGTTEYRYSTTTTLYTVTARYYCCTPLVRGGGVVGTECGWL